VQVLDYAEEELELPEGLEVYRAVLSSGSEVSISISHYLTLAYNKLFFVVRLSTTFLWCLTKKPNKKSHLALSSLRNAAKVVQ
jgi:hypothetical protein